MMIIFQKHSYFRHFLCWSDKVSWKGQSHQTIVRVSKFGVWVWTKSVRVSV